MRALLGLQHTKVAAVHIFLFRTGGDRFPRSLASSEMALPTNSRYLLL